MRQRKWRLLPLFVFLFFSCATVLAAQPEDQNPLGDSSHHDGKDSVSSWRDAVSREGSDGTPVSEALSILRRIRPSSSRLSKMRKPSGFIGTTAYYAKELFYLLFMNGPPQTELITSNPLPEKLSQPLSEAVKILEDAAEHDDPRAIGVLADMNFFGNYTHPRNYSEAFQRYHQLADLDGDSTAQYMLGFMYATGIGGATRQDQAKAMLYHTFAADAGDIRSQMTVGYRHHAGISAPRNCDEAVQYYRQVAERAIAFMRSGPPGDFVMYKEAYRIADDNGGVYGEGASASSSGQNAKQGGPHSDTYAAFDDVMEYLDLMSRKGDLKATFNLGRLYYDGTRSLKKDYRLARHRFLEVARTYWGKDGRPKNDVPLGTEGLASKAAGYLGRMFLRGEGVKQDFELAHIWLKRGISNGSPLSQYHLGVMYLHGLGIQRDPVKAAELFSAAADQGYAPAQVRLGALFLDQGDATTANKYFDLAARQGHIEAFYYLAELAFLGIGRDRSCNVAASYYKVVAEKAEIITSSICEANAAYENGDLETALVEFMMAAEQGFEVGQANVAYLLDQAKPRWTLASLLGFARQKASSLAVDSKLALIYWTRSAKQNNVDSMVKMGDYYLAGLGTSPDQEKAAASYQAAAEGMQSAQAMWNLGWMHENGIGIEQDFHLAKRYYDQALETNQEAYLPVKLALLKLRARSYWNDITHGRVKSIQEEERPKKARSLSEWLAAFLEADAEYWERVEREHYGEEYEGQPPGGTDMPGDDLYEEIDEGIIQSLIIVALAATFAFLVYYRQQLQINHRRRREEEERRRRDQQGQEGQAAPPAQPQEDRGLFPNPGDPEFMNWAVGGVGH